MQYFEIICFALCFLHFVLEIVFGLLQGRKINKLCDKCGSPIFEGSAHSCKLSSVQLEKLVEFVSSIKGDGDGSNL